uniref:Uncharacterized protein n=1 Tax=viral metagenome TaxID=1070528 RepID=A0A6H1ZYV3_9ZZZZ
MDPDPHGPFLFTEFEKLSTGKAELSTGTGVLLSMQLNLQLQYGLQSHIVGHDNYKNYRNHEKYPHGTAQGVPLQLNLQVPDLAQSYPQALLRV